MFFLMKKRIKGFTLIELLIVLTIIGLFILAALWTYQLQVFKGRDAKRKADLGKLQRVLEDYLNDHVCYPEALECASDFAPYLSQIPCDPVNSQNHIYYYSVSAEEGCKKWYKIFTTLEYQKDPIIAKIGCTPENCGAFNYLVGSPNVEVLTSQLGEIFPPPYPSGVPTPTVGVSPTPSTSPTPSVAPTSSASPTVSPTPTGSGTPTSSPTPSGSPTTSPTPCPGGGGWFSCLSQGGGGQGGGSQGGKCNYIDTYWEGAVCSETCNLCAARGCSAYPSCLEY